MPTLYERAGGEEAFGRLIDAFYDHVERDVLLASFFPGGVSAEHVEWGTRLAQHNSQPGAELVEHAPVPRWGWGEAPPYQP